MNVPAGKVVPSDWVSLFPVRKIGDGGAGIVFATATTAQIPIVSRGTVKLCPSAATVVLRSFAVGGWAEADAARMRTTFGVLPARTHLSGLLLFLRFS